MSNKARRHLNDLSASFIDIKTEVHKVLIPKSENSELSPELFDFALNLGYKLFNLELNIRRLSMELTDE